MQPLNSNSRAVMGFSGDECSLPWSIQCCIRSRLIGAYTLRFLDETVRRAKPAARHYARIYKALLGEPLRNGSLTTFKTSFWFSIPCASLLALVTSSRRSSPTSTLPSTEAFLLPNKMRKRCVTQTMNIQTACCEFCPGERFDRVVRAALERIMDDMSAK
jgi:hypothetical protein